MNKMSLNEFKFLGDLIKEYQTRLCLEYEYEPPKSFTREFISSIDLLDHPEKQNLPTNSQIPKKKNIGNFEVSDIVRLKDRTYYYIPTEQKFETIFDCILNLQQKFNIEDILQAFSWQDFEYFLFQSLDALGFFTIRNFRFSDKKKRHEVDIISREGQKILFIDAKHWNTKTASSSALIKVAQEQVIRANHLVANPNIVGDLLNRLKVNLKQNFQPFKVYPIILVSSNIEKSRIVNGIPIFPVYQWGEFMQEFSKIEHDLKPIIIKRINFQQKLTQIPIIKKSLKKNKKKQ